MGGELFKCLNPQTIILKKHVSKTTVKKTTHKQCTLVAMYVNTLYPMTAVILHWQNSIEAYVSWSALRNFGNPVHTSYLYHTNLASQLEKKSQLKGRPTPSQTQFHLGRALLLIVQKSDKKKTTNNKQVNRYTVVTQIYHLSPKLYGFYIPRWWSPDFLSKKSSVGQDLPGEVMVPPGLKRWRCDPQQASLIRIPCGGGTWGVWGGKGPGLVKGNRTPPPQNGLNLGWWII